MLFYMRNSRTESTSKSSEYKSGQANLFMQTISHNLRVLNVTIRYSEGKLDSTKLLCRYWPIVQCRVGHQ